MPSQDLSRFWRSLEEVPTLSAVEAEWRQRLGESFSFFKVAGILRWTERSASSLPCLERPGCRHRVIARTDGFTGKCDDEDGPGCNDRCLSAAEIAVWEFNFQALGRAIATGFECDPKEVCIGLDRTRQIASLGNAALPVLLTLPLDSEGFANTVAHAVARWPKGFVLLAPTKRFCDARALELLSRVNAGFFALEDHVEAPESGRFYCRKTGGELFAPHLPAPTDDAEGAETVRLFKRFEALTTDGEGKKASPIAVFNSLVFKKRTKSQTAKALKCARSLITKRVKELEKHFGLPMKRLVAYGSDLEKYLRTVRGEPRHKKRGGAMEAWGDEDRPSDY